ncbi:MAG TPA: quinone-dependent dihydroorotate dehydrogenase [Candidatus Binataceae bacterium]|nr:quinone-dependent dihydroorotate dehydrogenase [Candidatus Binataceae bacterium]
MAWLCDMIYRVVRPLLFRMDAERSHRLTIALLSHFPRHIARHFDPPELQSSVMGLSFSNPVGLAAGMDKDALAIRAWNALGFGFAEIGTIAPRPQAGNSRPRIWRIPERRALVNRMGFPSDGIEMVAPRIRRVRMTPIKLRIAINVGPNKDTASEHVAGDCAAVARQAAPLCDFMVVNLSSPNTPGLRDFQAPERMRTVVEAIRRACADVGSTPPLLLKLAPDLESSMLAEICAASLELELAGIVATNTTLNHAEAGVVSRFEGGLSGEPLKLRAREVIGRIRGLTSGRIVIVGVGGVASAEDAYGHIRAGANLVELYTGLIYRGPGVVCAIKAGLRRLLMRDGFRSISEAVGRDIG